MKKFTSAFCQSLLLLAFLIPETSADSYRCGRKLVTTGDSRSDLLRICGEPVYRDKGYENITIEGVPGRVHVERWYYRKSKRSLERKVLLYRGEVTGIEVSDR